YGAFLRCSCSSCCLLACVVLYGEPVGDQAILCRFFERLLMSLHRHPHRVEEGVDDCFQLPMQATHIVALSLRLQGADNTHGLSKQPRTLSRLRRRLYSLGWKG